MVRRASRESSPAMILFVPWRPIRRSVGMPECGLMRATARMLHYDVARRATDEHLAPFLAFLEERSPRPFTIPQMAERLGIARYDHRRVQAALDAEASRRRLRRIGKTRYQWRRETDEAPRSGRRTTRRPRDAVRPSRLDGRYVRVQAGFGFVEVSGPRAERFTRDVLVPRGSEGAAMHGDGVTIELEHGARRGRAVGRVVAVTRPAHPRILGRLERMRDGWAAVPARDVLPPVRVTGGVVPSRDQEGRVAVVRITRPPAPGSLPEGDLERVLGTFDDPEVQVFSVALEHGLRIEHDEAALAEAARLPRDPVEADFDGRRDLRALPFVTIDGDTARDFDDAVCLEPDGAGHRLYVAIADVSHY